MKTEKLDWLKAVKERPEDAAIVLEVYFRYSCEPEAYIDGSPQRRILKAARVQTVAEAESVLATLVEEHYCVLSDVKVQLAIHKAVDKLKEARAREAEEEGE